MAWGQLVGRGFYCRNGRGLIWGATCAINSAAWLVPRRRACITLFATSLSYFTYRTALPDLTSPRITPFQPPISLTYRTCPFGARIISTNCADLASAVDGGNSVYVTLSAIGLALRAVGSPDSLDHKDCQFMGFALAR